MDCDICCVKTTSKRNPILNCSHCDLNACHNCHKRFICESINDPQCMNCKTAFTQVFLHENFTKQYMNTTYKEARKNVLFDREKALLPHTQIDVERELDSRKTQKKLDELKKRKIELKEQLANITVEIKNIERYGDISPTKKTVKIYTTHKCVHEGCRGFLDDNFYCSLCENTTCKKCNEIMDETHECKQENIETMNLLKKDSKPCPGCGILITKIIGCSQMWCTSCHTTFNFNTGEKINGVIHNPHYYEFLRNSRNIHRNPQDIPCGGLPDARVFSNVLNGAPIDTDLRNTLFKIHRHISHAIHQELPRVPTNMTMQDNRFFRKLRVSFLLNEVDTQEFKNIIYTKERAKIIEKEFGEMITMVIHTSSELLEGYMRQVQERRLLDPTETLQMLENLRVYANTNFKKIGNLFNRKFPTFNQDFYYYRFT